MKALLLLLLGLLTFTASLQGEDKIVPWVVIYSGDPAPTEFNPFELIILDSDDHPPIRPIKKPGKTLLGYISLGEVEDYRSYFKEVRDDGILLQENENWPGSFMVDFRSPLWTKRVIEEIIPNVLLQRFDGIMIDTMDNAELLEESNPEKYKGMKKAAADLIQAIRMHYPKMPIMVNRGYYLFSELSDEITMLMAEDVMTTYDFKAKKPTLRTKKGTQEQLDILEGIRSNHPTLQLYSLDYWYPKDTSVVETIYETLSKQGISPYVSTIELDRIYPRPEVKSE